MCSISPSTVILFPNGLAWRATPVSNGSWWARGVAEWQLTEPLGNRTRRRVHSGVHIARRVCFGARCGRLAGTLDWLRYLHRLGSSRNRSKRSYSSHPTFHSTLLHLAVIVHDPVGYRHVPTLCEARDVDVSVRALHLQLDMCERAFYFLAS